MGQPKETMTALVTGASGFLGGALSRRLLADGHRVHTLARRPQAELEAFGAVTFTGDICDAGLIAAAMQGCDVVFHVAGKVGYWGPEAEFVRTNVSGTQTVIDACRALGVARLVYTSSPSVVHGGRDLDGVDESAPYPERYASAYQRTKAVAERAVLAANSATLATVALRPHLIWGPGDPNLLPGLVERARKGRLFGIGSGRKLVDCVYIDNAVDAHILAALALAPGSPAAGRAYFISQGQPLPIGELIARLLDAAGLPPPRRRVPVWVARSAARLSEFSHKALRLETEPPLTRAVVEHLTTAHWFDLTAARADLGYEPKISIDQGFALLRERLVVDGQAATPVGQPRPSVPTGGERHLAQYHFTTRWAVRAPIAQVWQVIVETETWPRWWKGVVSTEILEAGSGSGLDSGDGVGQRIRYVFRSALPYRLTFEIVVREVKPPHLLVGDASGELEGIGRWDIAEDGGVTTLVYTWHVRTTGTAMNVLAPFLRPAFVWNHHVVMRWGAEGLARHLEAPLLGVTSTPNSRLADLAPLAGLLAVLTLAVRRWRRRGLSR